MEKLLFGSKARRIHNVNSNFPDHVRTHIARASVEEDADKPYFINCKTEIFGKTESRTFRFKYKDNRDIVLNGMIRNGYYTDIHAGKFDKDKKVADAT